MLLKILGNKFKKFTGYFWSFFLFLILGIAMFLSGYLFAWEKTSVYFENDGQEKHESGYRFISPLLECGSEPSNRKSLLEMDKALSEYIDEEIAKGTIEHASVYWRDLNNGPWIGINEKELFSPASLMKVPIMIAYLKAAEKNPYLLQQEITIDDRVIDNKKQNILHADRIKIGETYTIQELIERMITKSDNFAANALIFYECGVDINKVSDDLRIFLPNDENAENFISVIDYASYFRVLYNSSYLNREMSEWALKLLSQTDFKEGLVAGVPSYVTVSHKFGERGLPDYYQLHDCGIVYRSNSPYLLCIMTKGDSFKKMGEVISELSSRIYNNKY